MAKIAKKGIIITKIKDKNSKKLVGNSQESDINLENFH